MLRTTNPRTHCPDRRTTLRPDEVYSLTAFLLFRHNVIKGAEVVNEKTLSAGVISGAGQMKTCNL